MFNIIQQTFNITFNTVNHVNTRLATKLTLSTVPAITTVLFFYFIYYYICNLKLKRGYITTTINHVFKCHLPHFAIKIINTHSNITQTFLKPLTKSLFSFIITTVHDAIKKISFLRYHWRVLIMGAEKSKNIGFVLYPSNIYHNMFLDFLKNNYDGYYIKHDAGADNYYAPLPGVVAEQHYEKEHIHCVVMLPYARTASGFIKSLPTVRYYKPCQLENVSNEIKQQLFTVFDISYLDVPVQEVIQPIVSHCEIIHDIYAYSMYVLHKDIKSKFLGKKEYNFNDVCSLNCSVERYQDYFKNTDDSDADMLDICIQFWSKCDGNIDMFMQLIAMHSNKLVKYVQQHAYFINTFIINRKEVFTNG